MSGINLIIGSPLIKGSVHSNTVIYRQMFCGSNFGDHTSNYRMSPEPESAKCQQLLLGELSL